jgi:hypothetical protein
MRKRVKLQLAILIATFIASIGLVVIDLLSESKKAKLEQRKIERAAKIQYRLAVLNEKLERCAEEDRPELERLIEQYKFWSIINSSF